MNRRTTVSALCVAAVLLLTSCTVSVSGAPAAIARAVPQSGAAYKPSERCMSAIDLANHIAGSEAINRPSGAAMNMPSIRACA